MNDAIIGVLLKQVGINPAELGAMVDNAKNLAAGHINSVNARLKAIEEVQLNLAQLVCDLKSSIDCLHTIVRESRGEIIPAGETTNV
jgi:hypothetical protein